MQRNSIISRHNKLTMPSFHDFARFVKFAQVVGLTVADILEIRERQELIRLVTATLERAQAGYGSGQHPGKLLQDAIDKTYLLSPDDGDVGYVSIRKLSTGLTSIRAPGYGVIDKLDEEALLRLVTIACIDDIPIDDVWKSACRFVVSQSDLPTLGPIQNFALALIAAAVDNDRVLCKLRRIEFRRNVLAMYGNYTMSDSVSARDILSEVPSAIDNRQGSEQLEKAAVSAVVWNLTALDLNYSTPQVPTEYRIVHNLNEAGAYFEEDSLFDDGALGIAIQKQRKEFASAVESVSKLRKRDGKVYVIGLTTRMTFAWMYIGGVLGLGITSIVMNLTRRENFFDRLKDASDIVVFLLISIFGLIKLTSEDPNALSNLVRGRKVVQSLQEVSKYVTASHEEIQKLISVSTERRIWLSRDGCCYGRVVDGYGIDAGPARVSTLKSCGFFILEGICKRPHHWDTFDVISNVGSEVAHTDSGTFDLRNSPKFSALAGVPR